MHSKHLFNELRALGQVRAPARVLETILAEVDLSDRYASLETALGPVFVAWNRLGVSAVMLTATGAEFEEQFRERFGRSALAASELPSVLGGQFDLRSVTEFERAVLLK